MTLKELAFVCQQNGVSLSDAEAGELHRFAKLLLDWNAKINLISRKDEAHILDRHILHSLTLRMPGICDYDFANTRVLDLGTGGGLPGIPLKIVTPTLEITLVDSIQKKIAACNAMTSELGLSGIRAVSGRAEELARLPEHAHRYDVIVSRAVAPLEDLVKWSRGLLKPGGTLFSLKGGDLSIEIRSAERIKTIQSIHLRSLYLTGFPDFLREEKKLVRVELG